jgi:ketosteroid isomerase-like protein
LPANRAINRWEEKLADANSGLRSSQFAAHQRLKRLGSNTQAQADSTPRRALDAMIKRKLKGDQPMKRILTIAILVMAISSFAVAQTTDKKAAPTSKAEQEAVKAAQEIVEAFGRTDVAALDRLLADDFAVIDSFGGGTKAQLMDAWKSGNLKYTAASDKNQKIRVYGNTAVTNGVFTLKGRNPNGDFDINAWYTAVWVKQQGRWRLVASQLTDIPQQKPQ